MSKVRQLTRGKGELDLECRLMTGTEGLCAGLALALVLVLVLAGWVRLWLRLLVLPWLSDMHPVLSVFQGCLCLG